MSGTYRYVTDTAADTVEVWWLPDDGTEFLVATVTTPSEAIDAAERHKAQQETQT